MRLHKIFRSGAEKEGENRSMSVIGWIIVKSKKRTSRIPHRLFQMMEPRITPLEVNENDGK